MTTATTESWKCYCKLKTAKKRSKKANENFNREFHCCSKNKCRFFRWEPSESTVSLSTTPTKRQHAKLQGSNSTSVSLTDSPLTKKRFFPPPRIETTSISLPRTDSKSTSIMSSSMSEGRFEKFDQMLHDPDSLLLRCSYFACIKCYSSAKPNPLKVLVLQSWQGTSRRERTVENFFFKFGSSIQ